MGKHQSLFFGFFHSSKSLLSGLPLIAREGATTAREKGRKTELVRSLICQEERKNHPKKSTYRRGQRAVPEQTGTKKFGLTK